MKERVIACRWYNCEKNCEKGREGTFWSYCQRCDLYAAIRHGQPARTNHKKADVLKDKLKASREEL